VYPQVEPSLTAENASKEGMFTASLMGDDDKLIENILSYLQIDTIDCKELDSFLTNNGEVLTKLKTLSTQEHENFGVISFSPKADFFIDKFNRELNFSLLQIPAKFLTFYKENFNKKCDNCGKKGLISSCLLCGMNTCFSKCVDTQLHPISRSNLYSNLVGNACQHSLINHNGNCAFINNFDGSIALYQQTRVFMYSNVFKNELGGEVSIEIPYEKFEKYNLNQSALNTIHKTLADFKAADTIVLDGLTNGFIFPRGFA
jgi:hypothetical protein